MRAGLLRLLARLACPLLRQDFRQRWLEWLLDLDLGDDQFTAVRHACRRSGNPVGSFYQWKLDQLALIAGIKRLSRADTWTLIDGVDTTDYTPLLRLLEQPRGVLIALPHHGHFVLSIMALARRLQGQRPVFVFYDSPEIHGSNAIFDLLHGRLLGGDSGVHILHNNRAGLARAVRELRQGSVVVLMPDVYRTADDTYQIEFFGKSRNVMLGSAVLARRTGATLLPAVSQSTPGSLRFRTAFTDPVPMHDVPPGDGPDDRAMAELHSDYVVTATLFRAYEPLMASALQCWQYSRNHFHPSLPGLPWLPPEAFASTAARFLDDPRIRVDLSSPISLD